MPEEIRCPSTGELISTWEGGLGRPGHERALLLLGRVLPGAPEGDLARWNVGRRDAVLFQLRRMLFGEGFNSVACCPHCLAEVELTFAVSDIWRDDERSAEGAGLLEVDGFHVSYRVPGSTDLEAACHMSTVDSARQCLLDRCVLSVAPEGRELTEAVEAAVVAAIAARDPDADRRIGVVCQECGESWEEIFDIATWLSHEIGAFVRRIVREVHSLAAAYGWREEDILAMSPTRRQLYLNILSQASV